MKKKLLSLTIALVVLLSAFSGLNAFAAEPIGQGTVTGSVVNIRAEQTTNSAVLTLVYRGNVLEVFAVYPEWVHVRANGVEGYIFKQYLNVQEYGAQQTAYVSDVQQKAEAITNYASYFCGTPYVYGGSTPAGFDCSGFTQYVMANSIGVSLNRTAQAQAAQGYWVSRDQLQMGDLVFFGTGSNNITHVGIYTADGMLIHSPRPGQTVSYDSLNTPYYTQNYVVARRFI